MEHIKSFFERDLFAKHCGIELVDVGPGTARVRMTVRPHHLNGVRTVHGGALFTLADFAFAVACNSHGTVAVAAQASITFLRPATAGTLTAEASEVSLGPKLASYLINITDESGTLVATFQGLAYRKNDTLEAVAAKG